MSSSRSGARCLQDRHPARLEPDIVPWDTGGQGIGDVMGADLDAAIVLGYQNGAWVSAIRNQGEWQGTLDRDRRRLRLLGADDSVRVDQRGDSVR